MSREIRIPNSASRRGVIAYAKLLHWVEQPATTGFDFEGRLLKPGQKIQEAELWPSEDWPRTPVLLECAGSEKPGWGHRREPQIYILWRYERESGQWREIARTAATNSEWCLILGPVARQAVVGAIPARPRAECAELADQVCRAIEEIVLRRLTAGDGAAVLARLHDLLAARAQQTLDNHGLLSILSPAVLKQKRKSPKVSRAALSQAAKILGAHGGTIGGRRRAERLPHERIVEIARMGALARWGAKKAKETAA